MWGSSCNRINCHIIFNCYCLFINAVIETEGTMILGIPFMWQVWILFEILNTVPVDIRLGFQV